MLALIVEPPGARVVKSADANSGIDGPLPLQRLVGSSVAQPRFYATMLGVFATTAAVLAALGIYALLAYAVAQRTREIGVRMALGATRRGIAAFVLSQSARPVVIGAALGATLTAALGAALLATPAADQIGSSVRVFDPAAYAAGLISIAAACACAALVPALRAARIDPVAAIRTDA